jgi:hypothetical protein
MSCCRPEGQCMTHLAEGDASYSTVVTQHGLVCVPNAGGQELVGVMARAAIDVQTCDLNDCTRRVIASGRCGLHLRPEDRAE